MASFLVPFMMSAVSIALPAVQRELSANAVELSWVAGGYILALAAILLPVGRLADIMGRRRTFVWGTGAFMVFSLSASLAWSVESLVALRVLQGVGAAMILSTGVAIVTAVYPPQERGRAMGILVACVYVGLSVGPLAGGMLTELIGWRSIFFLCLPPGLATLALASRITQEWRPGEGERFDVIGSLLYGMFVVCCVNGLTNLGRIEVGAPLGIVSAALFGLFVWRCRTFPYPILRLSLFTGNRVFSLSSLATLINYAGTFAVGFLLSLHLQVVTGFSPRQAGLILVIQPAVQSLLSPLVGVLSDRWSPSKLASAGMGCCAVGLFGMCTVEADTGLPMIGALLSLMGIGFALFASPNMTAIMQSVQPKDYSIASSMVATMRTFGMSLSMGIVAVVFGFFLHGQQVSTETVPQFLESMHIVFAVCAGLCGVGVFCSLQRVTRTG